MLAIFLSWHQIPEKLFLPDTWLLFGKYLKLEERIHITGVHDPIWIICPRSWNAYQPCNLLPLPYFCSYNKVSKPPPPVGKIKRFFFFFLCIILKKYTPTFQATNLIWHIDSENFEYIWSLSGLGWENKNKKENKNYVTLKNNNDW